jgi:hypothetical protein
MGFQPENGGFINERDDRNSLLFIDWGRALGANSGQIGKKRE